jgi:hypothetical protein
VAPSYHYHSALAPKGGKKCFLIELTHSHGVIAKLDYGIGNKNHTIAQCITAPIIYIYNN